MPIRIKEINIASNSEISMADTLNLIKDIMQSDVSFVTNNKLERSCLPRPIGEIPRVPKKIGIDSAIRETNNPNEISSYVAFHGASKQQTTNNLITSLTDWRPEYSIEKGLKETIDWFLAGENLKKYKAGIYNL